MATGNDRSQDQDLEQSGNPGAMHLNLPPSEQLLIHYFSFIHYLHI